MPNRIIKESICTSADIDELSSAAELLFYRLIVNADDYGLFDGRMMILASKCYPLKSIDINVIQAAFNELVTSGIVIAYTVDSKPYGKLKNWSKHQQIRAQRAKFPQPDSESAIICNQLISDAPGIQSNPIQSESISTSPAKLPTCPTQSVVDLYHAALPEMPIIRLMSEQRKKAISNFWKFVLTSKKSDGTPRAETADDALTWMRDYFERARDNDFLMGRGQKVSGHEGWQCDLDFLMTEKGKKFVIEKTREAA